VDSDAAVIRRLVTGYPQVLENGCGCDTPAQVVRRIQLCRLVVTGSYHAAVFALAQGISAIGLARSSYYLQKFQGLADQFGRGCHVVHLGDPALPATFARTADEAWSAAEHLRPQLLAAAAHQIELSRAAYARLRTLVAARSKPPASSGR
jgi:polysaccharide pyruvyl transferase WcaK-like protein